MSMSKQNNSLVERWFDDADGFEVSGSSEPQHEDGDEPTTVGCLIIKDGKVLTGVRKSDFHPFEICGGGGHIEEGETPEDAAIRECQEEFGITPVDIMPIGIRTGIPEEYGVPVYFFATDYEGEIRCDDHSEMVAPHMSDLGEVLKAVRENKASLFPPFADSIRCLENFLAENGSNKPFSDENALTKGGQYHIIKMDSVEWKESEHPRDEKGRFTSGGGSSSGGSTELSPKLKESIKNSGSEATKDHTVSNASPEVQTLYDAAREQEKLITPIVAQVADSLGGTMEGLDFSVKTGSSVAGKIQRKMASDPDKYKTDVDAFNSMTDIVRYTMQTDAAHLVEAVKKTTAELRKQGYTLVERDNKYLKPDTEYKGIHALFATPDGSTTFEMQFHSPEALEVKNENHLLYEEQRKVDTPVERKAELGAKMKANTARIPEPANIKKLKNVGIPQYEKRK